MPGEYNFPGNTFLRSYYMSHEVDPFRSLQGQDLFSDLISQCPNRKQMTNTDMIVQREYNEGIIHKDLGTQGTAK